MRTLIAASSEIIDPHDIAMAIKQAPWKMTTLVKHLGIQPTFSFHSLTKEYAYANGILCTFCYVNENRPLCEDRKRLMNLSAWVADCDAAILISNTDSSFTKDLEQLAIIAKLKVFCYNPGTGESHSNVTGEQGHIKLEQLT